MSNERKPHKHADIIKAWADGAVIQVWETISWQDCASHGPTWSENRRYRIKPEQSDVEKYGVEVGDVWRIDSSERTDLLVSNVDKQNTAESHYTGNAYCSDELLELIFRRGVVNKL